MDHDLASLLVRMLGLVLLVMALVGLPYVFVVFAESSTQWGPHWHWLWTREIEGIRAPMALLLTVARFLVEMILGIYFLKRYQRVARWLVLHVEVPSK